MTVEVVEVEVLTDVSDEVVTAFQRLVPQLSSSSPPPGRDALRSIVAGPATTMLLARLDGDVVGTLTLAIFPIPTGTRAWIEDVIVDENARGRGIGETLTRKALELAESAGAKTVDLTSRPSREAAGRLYERVGFQLRNSRVYRFSLG